MLAVFAAAAPVDCMGLSGTTENLQAWEGELPTQELHVAA